jgi:hypothetical protein
MLEHEFKFSSTQYSQRGTKGTGYVTIDHINIILWRISLGCDLKGQKVEKL